MWLGVLALSVCVVIINGNGCGLPEGLDNSRGRRRLAAVWLLTSCDADGGRGAAEHTRLSLRLEFKKIRKRRLTPRRRDYFVYVHVSAWYMHAACASVSTYLYFIASALFGLECVTVTENLTAEQTWHSISGEVGQCSSLCNNITMHLQLLSLDSHISHFLFILSVSFLHMTGDASFWDKLHWVHGEKRKCKACDVLCDKWVDDNMQAASELDIYLGSLYRHIQFGFTKRQGW